MNSPDVFHRRVHKKYFSFGLSPLHAWIRFMEWILKISFRLNFLKWKVTTKEDKETLKEAEKLIKKAFREKLGLRLYMPKPGGCGNSNDGNSARRFFRKYVKTAEITGVDVNLLKNCYHLLVAISTGKLHSSFL